MKNVLLNGQEVRIASLFEAKDLHLGANLIELSRDSEDLVKIVS